MILASILDKLSILCWQNTKDAQKGRNFPQSVLDLMINKSKELETTVFDSIEEFERMRQQFLFSGE